MVTEDLGSLRLGRLHYLAVFCLALAIRVLDIALVQPKSGPDTADYIALGRAILESGPRALSTVHVAHPPLYSLFLAIGLAIPVFDIAWFAALSQAFLGAATAVILARMTARETGNGTAGLCAGLFAAVQISFVFWAAYVLSDTLFLFLLAMCADRVLALRGSRHLSRDALGVGILVILVVAARPTGVVFGVAVLALVVASAAGLRGQARAMLLGSFSLPIALLIVLAAAGGSASGWSATTVSGGLVDWSRSAVENGLLWTEAGRGTSGVDLDVSPPPVVDTLPPDQRTEFLHDGALAFATRHPEFVIDQGMRKFRTFWTPVLPSYSFAHALASSAYFLSFYALAVVGLLRARGSKWLVTVTAISVVLFTLTSLITFVDYDQRYRLPAELMLVPLAGIGLAWVLDRVAFRGTKQRPPVESSHAQPMPS